MTAAVVTPAPSLSAAVLCVLNVLSGEDSPHGQLRLLVRGHPQPERRLPATTRTWIEAGLLDLLEAGWPLHLSVAVHDGPAAVRLHALTACWTIASVDDRGVWQPSPSAIATAVQQLETARLPPTAILFGSTPIRGAGYRLVGLWRLDAPLPVRDARDEAHAVRMLRALAQDLGADPVAADSRVADLLIPVPGSSIPERTSQRNYVECAMDASRTYAIDAFEGRTEEGDEA